MLSADAKATMRANLELELKNRREKLLAMCDAQVASLRSRLERRVNRVPIKQRKLPLISLIEATAPPKANKEAATAPIVRKSRKAPEPAQKPTQKLAPKTQDASKPPKALFKTAPAKITFKKVPTPAPETAPAPKAAPASRAASALKTAPAPKSGPISKPTRGTKRSSNELSTDDKENNGELHVPKKRAKVAPAAPAPSAARPTRTTRAASRKVAPAAQILSPKTDNARPAPQARTRRQR